MHLPEDRRAIDARIAERKADAIVDKLWQQRERGRDWLKTIDKALTDLGEATEARVVAFRERMQTLQRRKSQQ